jgi:hypothetical protein
MLHFNIEHEINCVDHENCNNSFSSLESKLRMKASIMPYLKQIHIMLLVLSLRKIHVLYQYTHGAQ